LVEESVCAMFGVSRFCHFNIDGDDQPLSYVWCSVVMITHDDRLAQAADRILLIEHGLIHEIGKEDRAA
jgi:hypothetical protein